jgi:hypothetical protein
MWGRIRKFVDVEGRVGCSDSTRENIWRYDGHLPMSSSRCLTLKGVGTTGMETIVSSYSIQGGRSLARLLCPSCSTTEWQKLLGDTYCLAVLIHRLFGIVGLICSSGYSSISRSSSSNRTYKYKYRYSYSYSYSCCQYLPTPMPTSTLTKASREQGS